MSDLLRINGSVYSWGSMRVLLGGVPYIGITAISYSDKRERQKAYGMAPHQGPIGSTRGKYTAENAKLTVFAHTARDIQAQLATLSLNQLSTGNTRIPIVIQKIEADLLVDMATLNGCALSGISDEYAEGPDAMMVDLEFDVMAIYRNKRTLFDSTRGLI